MRAVRAVRAVVCAVFASALACGDSTTESQDASTGDSMPRVDGSTDGTIGSRDADADSGEASAVCGPVDPNLCQCSGSNQCCAQIIAPSPTCELVDDMPLCLPDCLPDSIQCDSTAGTLGATRPFCNSKADCQSYSGYENCCNIACRPHRASICVTSSEAQSRGLTCL